MKTFTNWLNVLLSRPNNLKKMNKENVYQSELFWVNHESCYVSMYMKHDWFKMSRNQFVVKYMYEFLSSKLEGKKQSIISVLKPIWFEMSTDEKYEVIKVLCEGWHYAHSINALLNINELFECNFISIAIKKAYYYATSRNYDINYFTAYGLEKSKI